MHGLTKALLISGVVAALLIGLLVWHPTINRAKTLMLYCAAGMKNPVAQIAEQYEAEYGVKVEIYYAGSGTLLNNLRVSKAGDLYLAADTSYIDLAREQGVVAEALPAAHLRPAIAVKKGNPAKIHGVQDLLKPDIKTALGNPTAASIGKQTELLMKKIGRWDALEQAVRERGVFKPTVNEVANDVKLGAVQAGIVWDATVNQYPELEAVPLEGAGSFVQTITVGVLTWTKKPTAALHFARYMTARDRGLKVFEKMGFPPVDGDVWADVPEITYYCGGVNRLAIQDTLTAFEKREGVRITTVYNGCGILMGSIKQGERPDGYHTCDASFMHGVEEYFLPSENITETDMVIVCEKGNPHGIKSLKDLAADGLRIGVANEKQSALGALTSRLLKRAGLYEQVNRNVVSRTPTADLLVNQIRTGSLDAVIVYRANTMKVRDQLEIVPIDVPDAKAVQSIAISKQSKHKYLMERLFDAVRSAKSRKRFTGGGFHWLEGAPPK